MDQETQHHHISCLKQVPIFNHLDNDAMNLIAKRAVTRQLKKGDYIYQASDKTDALFIVHKGAVRVFRLVESGREQIIRILTPGEFAGEWAVFTEDKSQEEFAQAMTDSSICLIYQEDLQEFLIEYPAIANHLLSQMAMRLAQSDQQTTTLSTEQVDKRLAQFLVNQVETDEEENIVITLNFSRKDIASYLGTTPETISRKFKELEQKGLIEQLSLKKIKIIDLDDLVFYE